MEYAIVKGSIINHDVSEQGLWMTSLNLQNKWRLVNCVIDWIETGKYAMPMFINPADPNVYTKRVKCHMFMMLFAKDTCGSSQLFLYAADQIIHEVRANFTPLAFAEFMAVFYETINDLSAYLKRELLQFTWEILPELRTLADETCIQLISNGFLEDFVLICNQCINIDCMEIFSPFESKWLKLEDGFLQAIGDLLCGTPSLTDVSTDDESEID